ncbi:MAG: hypothetical protein PHT19_16640 [Methylococcus sp.]|nr:hypothetical protein [Methylococcus sp.]
MKTLKTRESYAMNEFTLEDAVSLIYRLAVLKKDATAPGKMPDITKIGHVCGVLTMNDQIEVVIKFHDELRQFTKDEFDSQISLLDQQRY